MHPDVSLSISPGSKQVLTMLADNGALADMIASGRADPRMRLRPLHRHGPVSRTPAACRLRTFNRNFEGRSGTARRARSTWSRPETAVAAALTGYITDPQHAGRDAAPSPCRSAFRIDDSAVICAPASAERSRCCGSPARPEYQALPAERAPG